MRATTLIAPSGVLFTATTAFAGMPAPLPLPPPQSYRALTEITVERLQVISFFFLTLLVAAGIICWLWSVLRRDIPQLPRLSYGGALAGVLLWGLLAVIVLTMISGARELMTPGAWKRNGPTYTLTEPPAPNPEATRMKHLMALRDALWSFADSHNGRFPNTDEMSQIPDSLWLVPGGEGRRYEYVPGLSKKFEFPELLAYEPHTGPGPQLQLRTDGDISPGRPPTVQKKEGAP